MDAGPAVQDLGPISPELVLVDPALAERVRRLLPDPTESLEPRAPAAIESRPSVPAPVRPEVAPMPVPRRRRRWARTVVLAVVVFAAGAASGGFLPDRHSAPSDVVLEVQSAGPAGTQGEESGPPQRPPAAKRSAQRHSAAKRSPQRPSAAKRSPQRPPRARPVPPHRTWAANVLGVAAQVGSPGVKLVWQRPTVSGHVVVLRARGNQGRGTVVFGGRVASFRDLSPRPCTAYRYTIVNYDRHGHRSTGVPTSVVTAGCT